MEKLGETCLQAIAGIFAQKRRQKRFHNAHITTKKYKAGDLVLAYMLKQHIGKLKKRGLGPFVIVNTSSSGALKLATLDGEEMPNWISGCRVKKYFEPLTTEMLQRMHAAKGRALNKKKMIEDAQRESKKKKKHPRAAMAKDEGRWIIKGLPQDDNHKGKQKISHCQTREDNQQVASTSAQVEKEFHFESEMDDGLDPYILIKLGSNLQTHYALLDTGAHHNSMAYGVYKTLEGVKLLSANITIVGFSGEKVQAMGYVNALMSINDIQVMHRFLVIPPHLSVAGVILGMQWQHTRNAYIDWINDCVYFNLHGTRAVIPFVSSPAYQAPENLHPTEKDTAEEKLSHLPTQPLSDSTPKSATQSSKPPKE